MQARAGAHRTDPHPSCPGNDHFYAVGVVGVSVGKGKTGAGIAPADKANGVRGWNARSNDRDMSISGRSHRWIPVVEDRDGLGGGIGADVQRRAGAFAGDPKVAIPYDEICMCIVVPRGR